MAFVGEKGIRHVPCGKILWVLFGLNVIRRIFFSVALFVKITKLFKFIDWMNIESFSVMTM